VLTPAFVASTCGQANGEVSASAVGGTGTYTYLWDDASAATTATLTGQAAGTYNVTVTDAQGCVGIATATITDGAAGTATTAIDTDVSCFGVCDGGATVTVVGGTGPFTYLWSNGETTLAAIALCVGTNSVDVTDANGCVISVTANITEPALLTATITSSTDPLCATVCDGTADVTAAGGTTAYTYSWTSGGAAAGETGMCTGTETVTVTDANGCIATADIALTDPPLLTAAVVGTDPLCNAGSDGSADLTTTGGTGALTYLWDDVAASTSEDIAGLTVGTYNVTVTDANGCTATDQVILSEPTAIVLTPAFVASTCGQANGEVSVSAVGGTGTYTYLWDDASAATTATLTGLLAGIYNVTVTDTQGCTESTPVTITDGAAGTLTTVLDNNVSCFGVCDGGATVTIVGGTGPFIYLWNNGETTLAASALCVGINTLNVTDANGCIVAVTVTITEPALLTTAITSSTDPLCNGVCDGTADLTVAGGTGALTYLWDDLAATTTENISGLCGGTFNVTVTDVNGCTETNAVTIIEPTLIVLNSTNTIANCGQADGSVNAVATGGTAANLHTYEWTDASGNVVSSNMFAQNLLAGTYTLTVTDDNSCVATVTETIIDMPGGYVTASVISNYNGADISCNGECNGEITISMTGGVAPYSYSFNNTAQTGAVVSGLCAGTYPIAVIDDVGCIANISVTLTEPSTVAATSIVISESCIGDCQGSITLLPTGGIPGYTYTFDSGVSYGTDDNFGSLCAGSYDVGVKDVNGCNADLNLNVISGQAFADANINVAGPFCLDAFAVDLTAINTGGNWSGNGITDAANGTFDPNVAGAGSTTITYTIGGACGDIQTTDIIVNSLPVVDFITDITEGCEPLSVNFTNTGESGNCNWNFGDGNQSTDCIQVTNIYSDAGSYNVSLSVTDGNGCSSTFVQSNYITVFPNPVADFSFGPQPVTIMDPTIEFTDLSTSADYWDWNFAGIGTSIEQDPFFTFDTVGSFDVGLSVSTIEGCTDSITYTVIINDELSIYVPNAFTPDGDGINDFFFPVISGSGNSDYTFFIFNRWGELIYEAWDVGSAWDGTYKGLASQNGIYIWKIDIKSENSMQKESLIGHVMLLK
jgi:gliding motility-associated-like protein